MIAQDLAAGATLADRYRVERPLGRGGMAAVYLAEDLRHGRQVALKVLRSDIASALGTDRFCREIRIAANLVHPHVVPLHDSGEVEGLTYYVMPYHPGESLRERLDREGELPVETVRGILLDVLDALAHAHEHGVLHRDVKPDNVLMQGRHAMVTDFGVAKAFSEASDSELTRIGAAVGTPTYMAPEQAVGDGPLDHRADIYSVGVMAYELLTGRPPFEGDSVRAMIADHVAKDPVPVRDLRPTVPAPLADAVMRCLAKRPADRFQSADEARRAIAAVAGPATGRRRDHTARRRRAVVGTLATVAAFAAGGTAFLGWARVAVGGEEVPDRRAVVDVFHNRTGDPELDAVGEMLQDWLTEGLQGSGLVETVPTLTARQVARWVEERVEAGEARDPVAELSAEADADLVVTGSVYRDRGDLRVQASVTDVTGRLTLVPVPLVEGRVDDVSGVLDEVRARLLGSLGASLDGRVRGQVGSTTRAPRFEAYALMNEGLTYYEARDYEEASGRFLRAVELDSTYVVPLLYASLSLRNQGDWARSDSVVRILEGRRGELPEHQTHWVEYSRSVLAGDLERARVVIQRASQAAPASKATYNLALTALRVGRPAEARRALALLDPDRGTMRGDPRYWMRLSDASHQLGDFDRELAEVEELAKRYPDDRSLLFHRVRALAALGRFGELTALIEAAPTDRVPPETVARRYRQAAVELFAHGHRDFARDVAELGMAWITAHEGAASGEAFNAGVDGTARYPQLEYQKARLLEIQGRDVEALLAYRRLYEAEPSSWWLVGHIGMLAAAVGDLEAAAEADAWLLGADPPYARSTVTAWRAAIAARRGNEARAVNLLKQSRREGQFWSSTHSWFHFADALGDYEPYVDFMAPRG